MREQEAPRSEAPGTTPGLVQRTLVNSAVCDGMEARLMQIECGFTRGFAGLQLLGHATEVCRDGKERARVALEHLGLRIPPQRLVISLTPADVKMDGNQFDLPVAVTLALLLSGSTPVVAPERWLFAAELGLSGELRPVRGVVAFALAALAQGLDGLVVAAANQREVEVLVGLCSTAEKRVEARSFSDLRAVLDWLFGAASAPEQGPARAVDKPARSRLSSTKTVEPNFDDMILGPELETLVITAAAGMHSLLLRGSPGTGKSMLAARLPSILPPLARAQHIDVLRIYSQGLEHLPAALLAGRPPYRAPHHQASAAAVLGSADAAGEIALAHGGVLFLDELPEFRRDLLEALREPLESGEVRLARSRRKVVWKAQVMLVAACNNCPCGWFGSRRRLCSCGQAKILHYRQRLSGPILDRIDLHVNMVEPSAGSAGLLLQLAESQVTGRTAHLLERVVATRLHAQQRNQAFAVEANRELSTGQLLAASGLDKAALAALLSAAVPQHASTRSVLRCLRVARTLADLHGQPQIGAADLVQAWRWQAEAAARERGEELPSPPG